MSSNRLSDCYRWQASRGHGRTSASLQIPRHTLESVRRHYGQGDVMRGFGLYDRPLLASYPRSGTNWVRYIVEWTTGRPTPGGPGQRRLHAGDDYAIDRAHKAYVKMNRYPSVVLVLRDYKECILRHHTQAWSEHRDLQRLLTDSRLSQPPKWYIKNINRFDSYRGPKLCLYYEDLLTEPEENIRELCNFLAIDSTRIDSFLANIDERADDSVAAYSSGGHDSYTAKARDVNLHSRTHLSDAERLAFDSFYQTRHRRLATKYLSRYAG